MRTIVQAWCTIFLCADSTTSEQQDDKHIRQALDAKGGVIYPLTRPRGQR